METHHSECLNCSTETAGNYCHECGQKTNTHRITFAHFITHDLVHGVWHLDKGLLFTIKESFLRPGYMAMNYINGKRIKYYNVFYLALLVIGINVLIMQYFRGPAPVDQNPEVTGFIIEDDAVNVSYYIQHYFKLLLFLLVPFFAFAGQRGFKKMNLNFAEHSIIGGNLLLSGSLWVAIAILLIQLVESLSYSIHNGLFYLIILVLPVRIYYQASRKHYNVYNFILRMFMWYLWTFFQIALLISLVTLLNGKTNIVFD